jgi:hypothetical protein
LSTFKTITYLSNDDKYILSSINLLSIQDINQKFKIYDVILSSILDKYNSDIFSFCINDVPFGNELYNNFLIITEEFISHSNFPKYANLIISTVNLKSGKQNKIQTLQRLGDSYCTYYLASFLLGKKIKNEDILFFKPNNPVQITTYFLFYLIALITCEEIDAKSICNHIDSYFREGSLYENIHSLQYVIWILDTVYTTKHKFENPSLKVYSSLIDPFTDTTLNKLKTAFRNNITIINNTSTPVILK